MSGILVPIVLLITSIGLFFTYISPAYDALRAIQDQDKRLGKAIKQYEDVVEAKRNLTNQYLSIPQADLDRLNLVLPDETDVVQTIIVLDSVAQKNRLQVESFSIPERSSGSAILPSGTESPPEFNVSTFRIVLVGSYENIKRFLYQVEQSVLVMDAGEMNIERNDKASEDNNVYSATIALKTYSQQ